ncbi:hypothetical protein DFJ63DRAFT_317265 [Scheffersomyces coipomensis]|uniref:uncharacterized protein n=1 Tax=Scheffersomyces coipomensis TaxID=1788519 RepID=UPI00315CC2B3
MSFNNTLGFNITKSTPTTSATNITSASATPTSQIDSASTPLSSTPKSPFLQNILTKTTPSIENSPKLNATNFLGSVAAPAIVTVDDNTTESKSSNNDNSNTLDSKSDLIGLFDKFDIGSKSQSTDLPSNETDEHQIDETEDDRDEKKESTSIEQDESAPLSPIVAEKDTIEVNKVNLMTIQPYIVEDHQPVAIPETSTSFEESSSYVNEKEQHDEGQDERQDEGKDLSDITGDVGDLETSDIEEYELKKDDDNIDQERRPTISSMPSESKVSRIAQPHIDPEEQYQQSHKPFYFQNFLNQLRKKSADPVVRYIRSFLVSFLRQGHTFTAEQRSKIIQDFKIFMNDKFATYEPFASMDDIDLENSREGLEKLIMNRLYIHCFPPEVKKQEGSQLPHSFEEDLVEDAAFSKQLEKFSWVNGIHLDLSLDQLENQKKGDTNFIQYSITEMNKINTYRAPRDKIICILNACKIIFSFLKASKQETNADAFVPLLILVLIKAKTENLISNISYIENFRGEEWLLHGETSYYLSSIQGAIGFIQNLGFKELTVDEEEYNAHMESWEAEEKRLKEQAKIIQPSPVRIPPPRLPLNIPAQGLSPSSVLLSSAEMFTKSITNFLSPSPQEEPSHMQSIQSNTNNNPTETEVVDEAAQEEVYNHLKEIFPTLDKSILKDVVFMNKGDMDSCIDSCLQLMSDA